MGHKIKSIRKRLESIENDQQFHLSESPNEREVSERNIRETHSYMSAEEIIGRGGDQNGIINHLSASTDVHPVSIIPIAVEKSAPKVNFSTNI